MRSTLGHIPRFIAIAICFIAMLLVANLSPTSAQPSPETWMDLSEEPDIGYGDIYSAEEYLQNHRITQSVIGTREHEEKSFPIINGSSYTQDWYESSLGYFGYGGQGYVPAGEQEAGFMENFGSLVFPTMNESVLLEQFTDGTNKAQLRKGSATDATILKDAEGMMPNFWIWKNPPSLELNYEDGSPYNLDDNALYSQVVYSFNGRWMIIWDMRGFVIRIDLEDLKISTYRIVQEEKSEYAALAISDSGRYIAVYVHGGAFTMLDTQGCTKLLGYIAIPEEDIQCKTKNMHDYSQEYFQDLSEANLEFYNEWLLRIRGMNTRHGTGDEITIKAPNIGNRNYVALGDSFSSGEGAGDYVSGTNKKGENMCHTSKNSYPYWISRRIRFDNFFSVACSGAKMENYWMWAQQTKTPAYRPNNFPGKTPQRNNIANASIVTIGMAGNDIGFSDMLSYCLSKAVHCYNSYEARMEIANMILELRPHLVNMYEDLLGHSPHKRRVYVIGYPQIMDTRNGSSCGNNVQFTKYQRDMSNDLITYFNAVIKSAATEAGVFYVSVENAFGNYKLCGIHSYMAAVHGLTFGNEAGLKNIGPFSNSSYHPTATGQRMLGQRILEVTSSFKARMPRPTQNALIPNPRDYPFTRGLPRGNGIIHKIKYNVVTDNAVVQRGIPNLVKTSVDIVTWAPRTFVNVVLFSDPITLGQFEVSANGDFMANISLPDHIPTGIHELQINGVDRDGEPTSVRQFIYVEDENPHNYTLPGSTTKATAEPLSNPALESRRKEVMGYLNNNKTSYIPKLNVESEPINSRDYKYTGFLIAFAIVLLVALFISLYRIRIIR